MGRGASSRRERAPRVGLGVSSRGEGAPRVGGGADRLRGEGILAWERA